MELVCPSCGAKHRTEDHPGAFEILCVCGYSILVPDEEALSLAVPERSRLVPIAVEEADEPLPLPTPSSAESAPQPLDMTPSEQLPEGMVYDPFELGQAPAFPDPPTLEPDFSLSTESLPHPADEFSESPQPLPPSPPIEAPARPLAERQDSAQAIVERSQSASMGRLLGSSYSLECFGLERDALVEVARRCLKLIKQRPWLESELRARQLSLESLPDAPFLSGVPELIALEIYLACYELGGSCQVNRA